MTQKHNWLTKAIKNFITPELVKEFNKSFTEYEVDISVDIKDLHNPLNWEIDKAEECDGSLWNLESTLGRNIRYIPLVDELVGIQGEIVTDPDDKNILEINIYPE